MLYIQYLLCIHINTQIQVLKDYMRTGKYLRLASNVSSYEGYVWRGGDLFISYSPEYCFPAERELVVYKIKSTC